MLPRHITFVGFGLLASSMANAFRVANLSLTIRAVSSPSTLARAREMNLADETFSYDEVENWARGTDLIILCSPILHILEMLSRLKSIRLENPVLVTDIGSTKEKICERGRELPEPFLFVGGHPMAGSEKRTLEFNDPALFENAYWFVCPEKNISKERYATLSSVISFLGSREIEFDPREHDKVLAWLSHMPQMLSSTLAGNLPESILEKNYQHFAGRAFRDMTRIAASGWNMWKDILLTNRDEIVSALEDIERGLRKTLAAVRVVSSEDSSEVHEVFEAGNRGRDSLTAPGQNEIHTFFEATVSLRDKPGAILEVLSPLASVGLNIREVELMKVRENVSGQLLLSFKTESEAFRAVQILTDSGFLAALR